MPPMPRLRLCTAPLKRAARLNWRLPVTDHQNLYLHLIRNEDGSVEILSWQTVAADETLEIDDTLPVWGGSESEEYPWN